MRKKETAKTGKTAGNGTAERPGTSGNESEERTRGSVTAAGRVPRSCETRTNWQTYDCGPHRQENQDEGGINVQVKAEG